MKFNNVSPTKEFDQKSRSPLYILTIVTASIVGFLLLIFSNLFIVFVLILVKHWLYTLIGIVVLIIIKIRHSRKKKK